VCERGKYPVIYAIT